MGRELSYKRISIVSLIALIVLIFAGSVVRITESGMGCPDWPTCFGKMAPPTHVSELPVDYKTQFLKIRQEKTEKLAQQVESMGFIGFAEKLKERAKDIQAEDFSFYTAWIEYMNRLVSVLFGIFILIQFIISFKFLRHKPLRRFFWLSLGLLILTFIQALIGSFVVYTDLLPGVVSIHLLFTLLIIGFAVYAVPVVPVEYKLNKWAHIFLILALIVTVIQIVSGTTVRQEIEVLYNDFNIIRALWIENVGISYFTHRNFAWVLLIINALLIGKLVGLMKYKTIKYIVLSLVGILVLQMISGIGMVTFDFPRIFQLAHVWLSMLLFIIQLFLFRYSRNHI